MSDRLGVAVVGLGVGEAHARAYLAAGCDLLWLYDLDTTRAERCRDELGAGEPAAGFEQILADDRVDAVSIASYDDAHFEQALQGLAAGKHVFVEKPLCRTLDEVRRLRAAWSASPQLQVHSNFVLRAAPLYARLRDDATVGRFGRIYAFDGDYLYGRLWKITEGWRRDVDDYSVMLGGGVHLVDLMLWITGERPLTVHAVGNRIATEGTAFRYDDYVAATFGFASGLIGRITANFGCVHRHQHVVRVFGTEQTVVADDAGARLHLNRDDGPSGVALAEAALPEGKGALVSAFLRAIRERQDPAVQLEHELAVVAACAAADASLRQHAEVEIAYG